MSTFARVQALRLKQGWTWEQTGKELGVSTAMLHLVKTGKRRLSQKVLFRLEQAEAHAGLRPPYQPEKLPSGMEKDVIFSTDLMLELKRRWQSRTAVRQELTLAIHVLFPRRADELLAWLDKH